MIRRPPRSTLFPLHDALPIWATIKFTIRLDRDADIEKARKVIKRVGQEMLGDPEFGPEFMQPLKMQGVQEIADSADRKSTRLNSSHANISYAVFCLKKKNPFI